MFMDPALDELWYKLDYLAPLVRCMPENLYEEREDPEKGVITLSFRRSIVKSDLERFELAASRVCVLTHDDTVKANTCTTLAVLNVLGNIPTSNDRFYEDLDSDIFRSLTCAGHGRANMFPRLQKLTWKVENDDVYPYIVLFLSPGIRNLSILMVTGNIASDRMRFSLLTSLVSYCPSVRTVGLEGQIRNGLTSWENLYSGYSPSARASFDLWTGLEVVALHYMDLGSLADTLARLDALVVLILGLCRVANPPLRNTSVQNFPKLRDLVMMGCGIDSCLGVLKYFSRTPLSSLKLVVAGAPRESQWAEIFNALRDGAVHDVLYAILISGVQAMGHPICLDFQTISPLLHFRCMHQLEVSNSYVFDLDDHNVTSIAQAWPHLKTFKINPAKPFISRLTLNALVPFAKYCPELEHLSLTVNATAVENYEKPMKGKSNSRVWELGVNDSPIGDPGRVAAFISDVFPNVTEVMVSGVGEEDDRETKRKWMEVGRLVPVFSAVRKTKQASKPRHSQPC